VAAAAGAAPGSDPVADVGPGVVRPVSPALGCLGAYRAMAALARRMRVAVLLRCLMVPRSVNSSLPAAAFSIARESMRAAHSSTVADGSISDRSSPAAISCAAI
jgi:hypothetical protein